MSDHADVSVEVGDDFVAVIEIHRPPNNFFDSELLRQMADAAEALDGEDRCRAIVLAAEGKHFCAGAKFSPAAPGAPAVPSRTYDEGIRLLRTAKPIVAAIQGAAIGGGLGMACLPDFRIGCPETRFAANFARLGFHHGFGLSVTLPRLVGHQASLELLYTGRRINGEEALRLGLLDRLVPQDQCRAEARRLAVDIAGSAPMAVQAIRQTMRRDLAEQVAAVLQHEKAEQNRLRTTSDWVEGVRADAERRSPQFVGR